MKSIRIQYVAPINILPWEKIVSSTQATHAVIFIYSRSQIRRISIFMNVTLCNDTSQLVWVGNTFRQIVRLAVFLLVFAHLPRTEVNRWLDEKNWKRHQLVDTSNMNRIERRMIFYTIRQFQKMKRKLKCRENSVCCKNLSLWRIYFFTAHCCVCGRICASAKRRNKAKIHQPVFSVTSWIYSLSTERNTFYVRKLELHSSICQYMTFE